MTRRSDNYVCFESDLLDPTSIYFSACVLPSSHLRVGALSAKIVWLETEERYIVSRKDKSCHDGKYADIDHVCWVEMGPYTFPSPDAKNDVIHPGKLLIPKLGGEGTDIHLLPLSN